MKILSKRFVTLSLVVCWISISASTIVYASPEDSGYSTDKLNALKDKLDPYVEDGRLPNYLLSLYHKGNLIYEAKKGHVDVSLEKPIERDTIFWVAFHDQSSHECCCPATC